MGVACAVTLTPGGTPATAPFDGETDQGGKWFIIGEAIAAEGGASYAARDLVTRAATGEVQISAVPLAMSGVKTITCRGTYDYPHAGASSARKKVNAHLIVTCLGTVPLDAQFTQLRGSSRMLDVTDGRVGAVSTKSGRGSLRVGGDLACLAKTHSYQAVGTTSIVFPPGYTPGSSKTGAKSTKRKFARDSSTGNCALR
jgi:hypothetical protein